MIRALAPSLLVALATAGPAHASLRPYGHGVDVIDRVKIRLDAPALTNNPGAPADVGATDFTLEFFVGAGSPNEKTPPG
jgi:hypothetical protein